MENLPKSKIEYLNPLVIFLPLIYFLFAFPFSFNYSIDVRCSSYLLPLYTILFLIFQMIGVVTKSMESRIEKSFNLFLLVFVFVCYVIYNNAIIDNDHATIIFVSLIAASYIFRATTPSLTIFWMGCFVLFWVQIIVCLYQSYFADRPEAITGTLGNSGILSSFLIVGLPVCIFCLKSMPNRRWRNLVICAYLFLIILIIYFTQARTAIICLAFIVLYIYFHNRKAKLSNKVKSVLLLLILIIIPLVVWITVKMYYMKEGSAIGRILIWKVSLKSFLSNLFLGYGLGQVPYYYPGWQSEYFASCMQCNSKDIMAAGETYLMFNEIYQLFKEVGILGLFFFGYLLFIIYRSKSCLYPQLLKMCKTVILTILLCCFTSYPLHSTPILYFFIICIVTVFAIKDKKNKDRSSPGYSYFTKVILMCFSIVISYQGIYKAYFAYRLKQYLESANIEFASVGAKVTILCLTNDGKYVAQVGEFFLKHKMYQDASVYLADASTKFVSYSTLNLLAEAYVGSGQVGNAIHVYKWLDNYVPSKFTTKKNLMNLYLSINEKGKAFYYARLVLDMDAKVFSEEVRKIKWEARHVISLKNKSQDSLIQK